MRVLLYCNNEQDLKNISSIIESFPIDLNIDKTFDSENIIEKFKKNSYDKVFIDIESEIGKDVVKEFLHTKPKQELYMFGDSYNCIDKSCIKCKLLNNKKMLIKPITQKELSEIIKGTFVCECEELSKTEFNLEKIRKTIHNEFPYFEFNIDLEKAQITSKTMPVPILVAFVHELDKCQIKYRIENFEKIILL